MLIERAEVRHDSRVRRAVRALHQAGYDVTLLHHGDRDQEAAVAEDGARGRTVLPAGRRLPRRFAALPRPVRRIALWGGYARAAARLRPDVVHAHDLPMLAPAWLAARATGAALVYDTHELATATYHLSRAGQLVTRALERALIGRCDAVVTVSPGIAAALERRYGLAAPPVVVRNVPELEWGAGRPDAGEVRDLRAAAGIPKGAPLILHQGGVSPGRGCDQAVDGLAGLPDPHLLFLGDVVPGYWEVLADRAERAGAADRVHHVPNVPAETLLAHTRQADAAVTLFDPAQPNYRLTYSNKVFEYIGAGLPVVAARDTAVGDLVERLGVGWAVPFGDAGALARALDTAIRTRDEPALRARLEAAAGRLNWAVERERLLELYRSLERRDAGSAEAPRHPRREPQAHADDRRKGDEQTGAQAGGLGRGAREARAARVGGGSRRGFAVRTAAALAALAVLAVLAARLGASRLAPARGGRGPRGARDVRRGVEAVLGPDRPRAGRRRRGASATAARARAAGGGGRPMARGGVLARPVDRELVHGAGGAARLRISRRILRRRGRGEHQEQP